VLCDSVIDCEPASTQSIPVETPVLPAVCPVFETPKALIADWFVWAATLPVIVCPFAPNDTPFEFENTTVPSDAVFAPAEM
jgi:hypothetical protein